jgi:hypothetical protein
MTPAGLTAPPPGAPPAAQQGVGPNDPQITSALVELSSKAPADCKKFAKAMCRNPSVPDASRLQLCSGYVANVNQLVKKQGAKAADACKALAQAAAP